MQKSKINVKNYNFFSFSSLTIFFCRPINAILLVLPSKEFSLRPELSSPPVSESRGGGSMSVTERRRSTEILVSNIEYMRASQHSSCNCTKKNMSEKNMHHQLTLYVIHNSESANIFRLFYWGFAAMNQFVSKKSQKSLF